MRTLQFFITSLSTSILVLMLAGCQAAKPGSPSPTLSETEVNSASVEPEDIPSPSEDRETNEDAALYDPLAIIRELGEAVDSPNITRSDTLDEVDVQPKTDLAIIDSTIWAEIISGFSLGKLKETKYADLHRKKLTHSPGFFSEFLFKGDIYLPYVWSEIKRRGLPAELALLPYVESAYSPWAVSRMGAVGMWQIMPGTARLLKLKLGKTCDQRRDVIHSTRAAIDYLEKMYAKFDDWLLAIAAYNAGPGRIERAIKRNQRTGKATGLALKDIRKYNPCIRSWITPAQEPYQLILPTESAQKFSKRLVSVSVRDYVRTRPFKVGRGDTLSEIAVRIGATVSELMMLNGMENSRIVAGRTIRVPSTSENISKQLVNLELGNDYGETIRYKVRKGDSLWKIAKRFQTTVKNLRKLNATSNLIRPGEWLIIPVN